MRRARGGAERRGAARAELCGSSISVTAQHLPLSVTRHSRAARRGAQRESDRAEPLAAPVRQCVSAPARARRWPIRADLIRWTAAPLATWRSPRRCPRANNVTLDPTAGQLFQHCKFTRYGDTIPAPAHHQFECTQRPAQHAQPLTRSFAKANGEKDARESVRARARPRRVASRRLSSTSSSRIYGSDRTCQLSSVPQPRERASGSANSIRVINCALTSTAIYS